MGRLMEISSMSWFYFWGIGQISCTVSAEEPSFNDYPAVIKASNANFAGEYTIKFINCGGPALCIYVYDTTSGENVSYLPNQPYLEEDDDGLNTLKVIFKPDSYLIKVSGISAVNFEDGYKTNYYYFDKCDESFRSISTASSPLDLR